MEVYNGMSGKELRDWRKANRRHFTEHAMAQNFIIQLKSLSDEDRDKIQHLVNECLKKNHDQVAPII